MAQTDSMQGTYVTISPSSKTENLTSAAHEDDRCKDRSWRAPLMILATIMVGLGLAMAHHFMNNYLDGRAVNQVSMSQAWVSRFGTTFAFLVKMFFVITAGEAYIQRQWWKFHRTTFTVKDLDALTTVLGNAFCLFSTTVWFRTPTLAIMAIVVWLIPLAAVITPGSLSVHPVHTTTFTNLPVPQPLFVNDVKVARNFSIWHGGSLNTGGFVSRIGGTDQLYRVAFTAATSGRPISLPSAFSNMTYEIQFHGPAVICGSASEQLTQNLTNLTADGEPTVNYMSWVPGDEATPKNFSSTTPQNLDFASSDAARIFVMSGLGAWSDPESDDSVNVTECLLYNASYVVRFDFQFPNTTTTILNLTHENKIAPLGYSYNNEYLDWTAISYLGIMESLGKLLVGCTEAYSGDSSGDNSATRNYLTSYALLDIDWTRAESTQLGVEQLFQNITLSILSNAAFTKNKTQADLVPVTVSSYPVTYVYDRRDLLLAYGISFACALICSIIGVHAFQSNHASYQNIFSTFIRASNDPELRSLIDPDDAGADPLPKDFAKARLMMT